MEDSFVLAYSFLEANAGKACHGTNQGKIALKWLTERAVSHAHSSLQCKRPAWQHHCVPTSRSLCLL
ncbi:hypothetical protein PVAP13_2NG407800 [Panicum virgatum]|uniref:Uncharacterized protein n=1 Tax=Panicum virgatum TaxID=38727 RepID=A0A8T0VNE1_PANVG|nr:hypothetical protein PVAP13_2NG407800 [Panicum virgatum]